MNGSMRRDEFIRDDNSIRVAAGTTSGRPGARFALLAILLSLVYLAVVQLTIGLRPEHVILVAMFDIGLLAHPVSARLMRALAIFLVFGILYDSLKIVPNYQVSPVDIGGLYSLERQLFGITDGGLLLTPNEYFQEHASTPLDLISGLFYLNWISVPILFGMYLYAVNKRRYIDFGLVFLLVNVLGFIGYYLYPAAPPWYVEQYGFTMQPGVTGSAAELVRFDALIGLDVFQGIYTRNSNVYAAVPSLHCAYPVVVLWYAIKQLRRRHRSVYFAVYMMGICFAAVYSGHHYIIDVILGVAVAVLGILLFELLLLRIPLFQRWLARYERSIS
jgi:inositol phosphorylceramide synthase catalytic subunit